MTEENTINGSTETMKVRKVRSSFTMDTAVMEVLKAKSVAEDVSVSTLIEKAVAQFLGI